MMRRLGKWLVETRFGRSVFRMAALAIVAGAAYLALHEEVDRQTRAITQRVEVIEHVEPIDVIRECLVTPRCRHLLAHPPAVRTDAGPTGGDAFQPAQNAGQQPKPGKPGGQGGGQAKPKRPPESSPAAPVTPQSSPEVASPPTVVPAPQPGDSGNGASAEHGVKTCVELVVSACVGAGL